VRAAKASAFSVKLSSDPSTDRLKRALLSKNEIKRNAVVSDSRGRFVVAEPNALFFCTALPLVNVRFRTGSSNNVAVDRNQLCCLGRYNVNFCVVGMQFCPDNDRHLVIWGTAEAAIIILNKNCDTVEKRIELVIELEPLECESEYLLKCEWLPHSETHVAAVCGTFIKVFDVRRSTSSSGRSSSFEAGSAEETEGSKSFSCSSSTCYTLAYEDALIRSAVLIPLEGDSFQKEETGSRALDQAARAKLVILFDSGKIHSMDIVFDSNGDMDDQGEIYIETIDGVTFPIEGIRRYSGATPGAPGTTSSTFGEGSSLVYLEQSGLLLYKCISSCVVALIVNKENGEITGSFEFLPQVLTSQMIGRGMDGYSISAPFIHWTELGTVERDGFMYYRVACTGKSTRTNQPKVLLVEFNERSFRVKELCWSTGSAMGLGLSLNTSFEGFTAFSAPFVAESCPVSDRNSRSFYERAFLAALSSNGSMLIFGEERRKDMNSQFTATSTADDEHARDTEDSPTSHGLATLPSIGNGGTSQPKFPLTIFETLVNVSDSAELILGGDGIGKDPDSVKRKLSIHNGEFFLAPSRDGCTLTISLRQSRPSSQTISRAVDRDSELSLNKKHFKSEKSLVIVAVRLLLGSTTTDYLPRHVSVMGRMVKLSQGVKRWYDLPLTDEEIMLGIRTGFVTLNISSSFDSSNNSLIDAMEVYALPLEELSFGMPSSGPNSAKEQATTKASGRVGITGTDGPIHQRPSASLLLHDDHGEKKKLDLSLLSIVHAAQIAEGCTTNTSKTGFLSRKAILQCLEATALELRGEKSVRNEIMGLMQQIENKAEKRQALVDQGTVSGVRRAMNTLRACVERWTGDGCDGMEHDGDGCDGMEHDLASQNVSAYLPGILATLNECVTVALDIARERPGNYAESHFEGGKDQVLTLALIGTEILSKLVASAVSLSPDVFPLAAANVVELGIHEIGMEWNGSIVHTDFGVVSTFLRSGDKAVVEEISGRIVAVCLSSIERNSSTDAEASQSDSDKPPIAYQCDSCNIFPIQRVRYTLEGGHDIDLCRSCYDLGRDFASNRSLRTPALINSKTFALNTGESMTCEDLLSMKRFSIPEKILEEVRMADIAEQASDNDEDAALQLALKMSLESQPGMGSSNLEIEMDPVADAASAPSDVEAEKKVSSIFDGVLELATRSLEHETAMSGTGAEHIEPLLNCLLQLVSNSASEDMQVQRGKSMAARLCQSIGSLIESCIKEEGLEGGAESSEVEDAHARSSLNVALCALSSLISGRSAVLTSPNASAKCKLLSGGGDTSWADSTAGHKDKTDPRFVCDVHNVPAVRRRCSKGVHKDRRFYVCGMDRSLRCKYFKWADEVCHGVSVGTKPTEDGHESAPEHLSPALKTVQEHVWLLLKVTTTNASISASTDSKGASDERTSPSLYSRLCVLIDKCYKRLHPGGSQPLEAALTNSLTSDDSTSFRLHSLRDEVSLQEDWSDGAFLSKAKLGGGASVMSDDAVGNEGTEGCSPKSDRDIILVHASLALLASVASTGTVEVCDARTGTAGDWIPLLCEIISTSQHAGVRLQSKRLLKRLCGGKSDYHRVRDHYIFSFQYESLLRHCAGPMQTALIARERARQCGPNWQDTSLNWKNLAAGGLLGTCDLISEDSFPTKTAQKIEMVLDSLIELTETRGGNWRHFCALPKLPQGRHSSEEGIADLSEISPVLTLFWIACCLPDYNVKALRLIEVALSSRSFDGSAGVAPPAAPDTVAIDESGGILSTDVGTDINTDTNEQSTGRKDTVTPEKALFSTERGLNVDDVHAFVMQFVLRGRTVNIRSIARRVAHTMCRMLPSSELEAMFATFIRVSLREVQALGQCSVEFLELLQALAGERRREGSSGEFSSVAHIAVSSFVRQLSTTIQVLQSDDSSVEIELEQGSGQCLKKNFDLCSCVHCHREQVALLQAKGAAPPSGDVSGLSSTTREGLALSSSSARSRESNTASNVIKQDTWLVDQIRPYKKNRLEQSTESSISAEFTSYVKLKCRMAVSEVHLSISDPRGRLVKTVAVYFSPRHVSDVNELKKDDYLPVWQHCGNLNLSRGATRASFIMSAPVIAANMKFEYAEFYEKANSGRSAEGGLIIHCPRCTRVVSNAHGVCGHCGEVAFQCRKCRHINYDKLDAFLCVECGYCASGGFSYELTAGIASNAVAITNEEDYERGVKFLRAAAKRQSDLRDHKLRKQLLVAAARRKKRARESDFDDLGWLNTHSPQMKRAMLGELPRSSTKGNGSHNPDSSSRRKLSCRKSGREDRGEGGGGSDRVTAASKARSLLSLARQLRNEASSGEGVDTADHLSRGDMLVRQALLNPGAGGAGSFDMVDDHDSDMLGLIGGSSDGGAFGFDMPDPLSRLVADIQARVRGSGGAGDLAPGGGQGGSRRRRRTAARSGPGGDDAGGGGGGHVECSGTTASKDAKSPKEKKEELDEWYQQMREAERECYEMRTRLSVWTRLNCDRIADIGIKTRGDQVVFTPTSCRSCSGKVSLSMLLLVISMLQHSDEAITYDFIRSLFEEPQGLDRDLVRYKRLAIVKIAMLSKRGADMVLNELSLRMKAHPNIGCAEILGSLLGKSNGVNDLERFEHLAEDILAGSNID